MPDALQTRDNAHNLPAEVQALNPAQQVAWLALAQGGTFREASRRAGCAVSTLWQWCQREPLKSARGALLVRHLDDAVDNVGNALTIGKRADATETAAVSNGLRAASMVLNGLGIGADERTNAPARAVNVSVNVHMAGGVLGLGAPAIDVTPDE